MSSIRSIRLATMLLPALLFAGCPLTEEEDIPNEMGGDESGGDDEDGGECFVLPSCDPLSPACLDGWRCVPDLGEFTCVELPPDAMEAGGLHEPCDLGSVSCDEGLLCTQASVSGCEGSPGCCLAVCDLEQPQCSAGTTCSPYFGDGDMCYQHVGVCAP